MTKTQEAGGESSKRMSAQAPRILVVDDDAVTRHILVGYLARHGYHTITAVNGEQAIALARTETLALVLLDLVIPAPDGHEVLKILRAEPNTRDVPVVVLTALDDDEEIERAFASGADDFLRKPFRAAELIARIRSQMRLRNYLVALAHKERDAQVMLELTRTLASRLEFRDILFTVVRRIAEVVNVDRCSIVVAHERGDIGFVLAASDNAGVKNLAIELWKYPEIQKVLQTGQPLTIDDVTSHPVLGTVRDTVAAIPFTSLTLLPISFEGRPLGVLFLRAATERGRLDEREISFCQMVSNATAIALRNARIMQQLQDETRAMSTAKLEAEQRVEFLERYHDLFNSAADGMVVIERNGHTLFANPRAVTLLGYTESEMRSVPAWKIVIREDKPRVATMREGFERGDTTVAEDIRVRRRDGQIRVISVAVSSVLRKDDLMLITFRDVTDERAIATELERTKDFLSALIESSPDAIVAADRTGTMILWNTAAERICGIPREQMLYKRHVETLYKPGVAREIMRLIRSPAFGGVGRLEGYRTELLDAKGEPFPVLLSAGIVMEHGKAAGSVGIFADLRERLRMEEFLAQAQHRLALSEKHALVAELAGAAAHELNQPLTAMMGYAELLRKRMPNTDPMWKYADVIVRETERLAEIVRKLGQITRYETKHYVGGTAIIDLDQSSEAKDTKPQ